MAVVWEGLAALSVSQSIEWMTIMGLVKTRRLAAMQKQQRAKAGMKPPKPKCNLKSDYRRRKP